MPGRWQSAPPTEGRPHGGRTCHAYRYAKSVLSRDPLTTPRTHGRRRVTRSAMPGRWRSAPPTAARPQGGCVRHAYRYAKSVLSRDPLTLGKTFGRFRVMRSAMPASCTGVLSCEALIVPALAVVMLYGAFYVCGCSHRKLLVIDL